MLVWFVDRSAVDRGDVKGLPAGLLSFASRFPAAVWVPPTATDPLSGVVTGVDPSTLTVSVLPGVTVELVTVLIADPVVAT